MKKKNRYFTVGLCIGLLSSHTLFSCVDARQKLGAGGLHEALGLTKGNFDRWRRANQKTYLLATVGTALVFTTSIAGALIYKLSQISGHNTLAVVPKATGLNTTIVSTSNERSANNSLLKERVDDIEKTFKSAIHNTSVKNQNTAPTTSSEGLNPIDLDINIKKMGFDDVLKAMQDSTFDQNKLKTFINKGLDVNLSEGLGIGENKRTLLMVLLQESMTDYAKILIKNGADLNIKDADGDTALIYAVINDPVNVPHLIKAGAEVNVHGSQGRTPLIYAAMYDHMDAAQSLLAHKADIDAKDNNGHTCLDFAESHAMRTLLGYSPNRSVNKSATR